MCSSDLAMPGGGAKGYVPSTAIQPGRLMTPSAPPPVQRPAEQTGLGELMSTGEKLVGYGEKIGKAKDFLGGTKDKAGALSSIKSLLGYADGGAPDYFPSDVLKAQKPGELEKPKDDEGSGASPTRQTGLGQAIGMGKDLVSIGSGIAGILGMFSDRRLKQGLG